MNFEDNRKVTVHHGYDVVVAGGGIAGISAAVAAQRGGARTLLIEKQINLGGLATAGLISWFEPLCDGNGNQIISGIAEELIRLSVRYGFDNLPEKWGGDAKKMAGSGRFATHFSPTVFSLALDDYVRANGVDIQFDTMAVYPVMEKRLCRGLMTETVSGREFFPAKFVIDASGDASVCSRAGVPTADGINYLVYVCHGFDCRDAAEFVKTGDMNTMRRWYSRGGNMNGKGHPEGMPIFEGISSEDENRFIRSGKEMMFERCRTQDRSSREIIGLPTMPQYRKIRHIVGDTVFEGTDRFVCEDSIGCCGDFRRAGSCYEIPYHCLYNSDYPNILAAGRIISAEGDGWEVIRVIPVCALTGQAAGVAAACCVRHNKSVNEIEYQILQKALSGQRVNLKL